MGKLIIITGPTAAGKDAIMHQLLKQNPKFQRIITTTTRSPRKLEREGIDYYFVSLEVFKEMEEKEKFLETNQYGGNWYGTPKNEFKKVFDGYTTIWRVDPTMAGRAKEFFQKAFSSEEAKQLVYSTLVIYLDSPIAILHDRLMRRGMREESILNRMNQDKGNWEKYKERFDHVIQSHGQVEETASKVTEVIDQA